MEYVCILSLGGYAEFPEKGLDSEGNVWDFGTLGDELPYWPCMF